MDCRLVAYMREHGLTTVEAVPAAQDNWVAHVNEVVNGTLLPLGNSWWMSANIPGKPRAFLPYLGPEGIGGYRKRCAEIAAKEIIPRSLARRSRSRLTLPPPCHHGHSTARRRRAA